MDKKNMMKHGFSLVELSIVLVILGLLVGGVLGGQSLIRAAEMRTITEERNEYAVAVNAFKNKYRGLPGDLRNAGKFWGYVNELGAGGNCTAPKTDSGAGTATCDGNGDGYLKDHETIRFWQHLGNAGMIAGNYIGNFDIDGTEDIIIGTHLPPGRYQGTGWIAGGSRTASPNLDFGSPEFDTLLSLIFFDGVSGNILLLGAAGSDPDLRGFPAMPFLTPEDTWNIDSKFDDGKPGTGMIQALHWNTCSEAANSSETNADYLLSSTAVGCGLLFVRPF